MDSNRKMKLAIKLVDASYEAARIIKLLDNLDDVDNEATVNKLLDSVLDLVDDEESYNYVVDHFLHFAMTFASNKCFVARELISRLIILCNARLIGINVIRECKIFRERMDDIVVTELNEEERVKFYKLICSSFIDMNYDSKTESFLSNLLSTELKQRMLDFLKL